MGSSSKPGDAALTPEQVRQLAELSLDILTISGQEGRFTWVNAAATRVLGWSFEELTSRPYFELLHPADVERTQQGLGAVLQGESVLDFENRYRHKDGSWRWLSWRCGPISHDGLLIATARDVTEYRRLRAAGNFAKELAERDAQLRAAEQSGGFGTWTWNPATNEVSWSETLYTLLGLPPSEPASFERFFEVVHPDDRDRVLASATAGSESGALEPQRYRIIRASDGVVRHIQATAGIAIRNDAGETATMAGALLDITDQVASERALRLSEAQLREAQRMANVGHWRWDYATRRSTWSEEMYRIYNARPGQEMNSETFYGSMHPEDRARVQAAARSAMEEERAFETAFRILQLETGEIRHVHMAARPDRAADGTVSGYIGIIHDVTERQQAKEALVRNEWVLREAQQAARIGSWTFDPGDGRVDWSDEMYRICGIPPGEPADMERHLSLVVEADRAAVAEAGLDAPRRDLSDVRYRIQRASDGEIRHVTSATRVLRNDEGEPMLVVGTTMDVTSRHRLEEELRHAQKMEAIGRLAGGVAHDFNNALTAIIGNAELAQLSLQDGGDPADHVQAVIDAGEQAADVTRQLLAFARRQMVQPAVLDPAERLAAVQRLLRPMLGEDVHVDLLAEPDGGRIRMDPGQLEQLLINLAVNARDAMPEGGVLGLACSRVTVGPGHAAQAEGVHPGEYVLIAVSDTGVGMDAATREHAFEPFFTTKETGRGTGLGLATCHGIVLQNGGHILCDSTPGAGTTFRIFFPNVPASAAGEPPAAQGRDRPSRGHETILVVEDEAPVLAMCAAALRRFGYRVLEAADGKAALAHARSGTKIHLLLTDVVLPDMRGPQVAEQIRRLLPDCPVVFASGYTEDAVAQGGSEGQPVNFIPKPYTPSELGRTIRALLDAR